MEQRLVYRMETPEGRGAFNAMSWEDYYRFDELANLSDAYSHPVPQNDEGLVARLTRDAIDYWWSCGCRSLTQLRQWFPRRTLPILLDKPIEFTSWLVPRNRVAFGYKQVLFDRDAADCIDRKPPTALYQ